MKLNINTKANIGLLLVVCAAYGCASTQSPKSTVPSKTDPQSHKPIEVPNEISPEARNHWKKTLYLLPPEHPARMPLRDRLVDAVLTAFHKLPSAEVDERRFLADEVFALHAPQDFRTGHVATRAKPIVSWLVQTYERRGDEAAVLAGLSFLKLAEPNNAAYAEDFARLLDWSHSVRQTIYDDIDRTSSLIGVYEDLIVLTPQDKLVERLSELHALRYRHILDQFQKNDTFSQTFRNLAPFQAFQQGRIIQMFPIEIIHLFFLTDNLIGARKHLEGFVSDGALAIEYLELLDQLVHGQNRADSYYTLARHLAPMNAQAGLKACILARIHDPRNPRYPLCIGNLFEELECPECAFEFYAEAANISPTEDTFTEVLELYRRALLKVHADEKNTETVRAIQIGDVLVDRALALNPNAESKLRDAVATMLYTFGEVEFDDGKIGASIVHLARTYEVLANVPALLKLAEVYYLKDDYGSAIDVLNKAAEVKTNERGLSEYWQAFLLERRADTLKSMGKSQEANKVYRMALNQWDTAVIPNEQAATAAIRKGIILDRLGDLEGSLKSFENAIRVNPDRQSTYAELLSFLVNRGHLDQAKKFYRLAYNQDRIEMMWKIYYSLWVQGLSMRLGEGSYDLAQNYLMHSKGNSWQEKIARYFSGKMELQELRAQATNEGQQVEADYYGAVMALGQGKKSEAKSLLENVIASNLLGYFEYRMARAILHDVLSPKDAQ